MLLESLFFIYNKNCNIIITYVEDVMFDIYMAGEEPEFNYIEGSPKGPEHWGELKAERKLCKIGRHQSPIDILYKDVRVNINPGDLRLNYKASNTIIKNTDNYVEVRR